MYKYLDTKFWHKGNCIYIGLQWRKFHPVRLFRPVRLLNFNIFPPCMLIQYCMIIQYLRVLSMSNVDCRDTYF